MRILSLAPLAGPGLEMLHALGDLEVDPWNAHVPVRLHSVDELVARLDGVGILIVEADHVPAEVFERTALRLLGVCRGEPTNVDVPAATKHGVVVIRTPGRNAEAVAEHALGLILALLRGTVAADDDVRAARWVVEGRIPQQRYLGRELGSVEVGLVGFGAVARSLARRLVALGARVSAYDPFATETDMAREGVQPVDDLGDLLSRADIVSVHAPLSTATRGLIGEAQLARMKPGALFVNTARYGIAAEEALLRALREGRLAGAAFDHFDNEFLPAGHALASMPNVILTPHIGGSTVETIANHSLQVARAILEVLEGKVPESVVNPDALPPRP